MSSGTETNPREAPSRDDREGHQRYLAKDGVDAKDKTLRYPGAVARGGGTPWSYHAVEKKWPCECCWLVVEMLSLGKAMVSRDDGKTLIAKARDTVFGGCVPHWANENC